MRFASLTVWYEWPRFLAGALSVAIGTILICLMVGVMLGLISLVSAPVDRSEAELWLTSPNTPSCDLGLPISKDWQNRLRMDPAVSTTDDCILAFCFWKNPELGNVLVMLVGANVGEGSLGPVNFLSPEQRVLLTEEGAVVIDRGDRLRLGITQLGQRGEIFGRQVRVVGLTDGMPSITGPFVICSLQTARNVLYMQEERTFFVLARCRNRADLPGLVDRVRHWQGVSAFTSEEFSTRSRLYWLRTTKAGMAVAFLAGLSLVIGTLVTSQTLYSATVASVKELALLRALGAPRWRLSLFVLQESLLVGGGGVAVGAPASWVLAQVAEAFGAHTLLTGWLVITAGGLTLSMALLSGLIALRSLRLAEPGQMLR
jgi:putative ABC transport system permease protein